MAKRAESVLVTDAREIEAVKAEIIAGDVYKDGETWANAQSLAEWRDRSVEIS